VPDAAADATTHLPPDAGAAGNADAARRAAEAASARAPLVRPSPVQGAAVSPTPALRYKRALVKISGEALAGDRGGGFGFDFEVIERFADEIKDAVELGGEIGLVIGGGNIVRGSHLHQKGMDRVTADYMGMLGTVINALALQDILERRGVDTRVMTAIRMEALAEPYIRRRALRHFEKKRTVIFAAGTGNPYFTTDTGVVLRAIEMQADVIIKATSVDGIYSADPKLHPQATRYEELQYRDVMRDELRVMDQTAITLCKENGLPLIVLNLHTPRAVSRAIRGERIGTLVR